MALPLKSGADLYNQQLIRAAVWNYSADGLEPSEYATGLIYFNTNPSSNMFQKLRFRTATDWKTIAFAEDLDVATNKDFKALKEKVDLLSGEVDTDAIISNMKEVTAFLEGFAEDANLMEALNKKLDKTGGTISGKITIARDDADSLTINRLSDTGTTYITFRGNDVLRGRFGFDLNRTPIVQDANYGSANLKLLHEGNFNDIARPLASGTWSIDIRGKSAGILSLPSAQNGYGVFATIGQYATSSEPESGKIYVGSDSNYDVLSVPKLDGIASLANIMNLRIRFSPSFYSELSVLPNERKLWFRSVVNNNASDWKEIAFTDSDIYGTAAKAKNLVDSAGNHVAYVSRTTFYIGDTIYPTTSTHILGKDVRLRYGENAATGLFLNSSGNVTIGATDKASTSTTTKLYVAGGIGTSGEIYIGHNKAIRMKGSNGTDYNVLFKSNTDLNIGYDSPVIRFGNAKMLINSSGNVLIGTDNDSGEKLQVDGGIRSLTGSSYLYGYATSTATNISELDKATAIGAGKDYWNIYMWSYGNGKGCIQSGHSNGTTVYDLLLQPFGGNVGVGGTSSAYKLYVKGTLGVSGIASFASHVNVGGATDDANYNLNVLGSVKSSKDIVAEGTVACKGVAAVGDIAGMGTVDKWIGMVDKTTNSQVYTHGLNTEDVTVSIYEKNGSEWVLVLTDVDIVDQNRIRVMFGTTPTIDHKIVVMG